MAESTTNGEDAIKRVVELIPDLVVPDLKWPKRTGFELFTPMRLHHQIIQ